MSSSDIPPFTPSEFKYTAPPNPGWRFGQRIEETAEGRAWMEGEKLGWKTIDPSAEDPSKLYFLLVSGIVPRPVAFVSTISDTGIENLAPFSWFNQVSSFPPVISVSCTRSADLTRVKDTLNNIKSVRGFTVNIISEPWIQQANICAIDAPDDVGEWPVSGLTKEPSIHVKPARVKESAFSMECELLQTVDILDPATSIASTTLVLGTIKYIHVRKDMLDERGNVDPGKLRPIARFAGTLYGRVSEGYRITRHAWQDAEPDVRRVVDGGPKT
ncbi:hypothetical protein BDZ94DRAFT_1384796 [Collybia nuda]|uniref:Flavin reductase like domain-containing protein n=1 Tax=Collybia nuda TaxID=64659 RepID=A0A9P5Y0D1_9AGAR|nr:hypothetical protein BDZ94DRAFT_1384796 [Collybia nuda]